MKLVHRSAVVYITDATYVVVLYKSSVLVSILLNWLVAYTYAQSIKIATSHYKLLLSFLLDDGASGAGDAGVGGPAAEGAE